MADSEDRRRQSARLRKDEPLDPPPPPSWSGQRLVPAEYEFWQQGPHRLHDRFRYRPAGEGWAVERLSP